MDINSKAKYKSFKISYDVTEIAWFTDPPATKGIKFSLQEASDDFGLWHKSIKRPTMDEFFTPKGL